MSELDRSGPLFATRDRCPVCASDEFARVYSIDMAAPPLAKIFTDVHPDERTGCKYSERFHDEKYEVAKCNRCSTLFQLKIPSEHLAQEFYDHWLSDHSERNYPLEEYVHNINEALILVDYIAGRTGAGSPAQLRMLDYGLGRGIFAQALAACGVQVFGFDLSEERMALGRERGITMLNSQEIRQATFDFINTEQVFEHLPEPRDVLADLSHALSDRGVIKISVPRSRALDRGDLTIDWSRHGLGRGSYMFLQPFEHLQYFTRSALDRMAADSGLHRVKLPRRLEWSYLMGFNRPSRLLKMALRPLVRPYTRNYWLYAK